MSERNPLLQTINGSGTPRLIVVKSTSFYDSVDTSTFTDTTVEEAEGTPVNILTSSVASPTVITTDGAHGLLPGDFVRIASHSGSTPNINGIYEIIDSAAVNTFTINVNVTVGGTGGTVRRTSAFVNRGLVSGMRIIVDAGDVVSFAKILSIDSSNVAAPVITIDEWSNGTPVDGEGFSVDGYIADLPRTQELTEILSKNQLVHNLYRGRKAKKEFGWNYRCTLDYSKYISPDAIASMIRQLNAAEGDALILIPRSDNPEYQYNVMFDQDISISLFGRSAGYKKMILSFAGMDLVSWPLPLSGYGFGYAQNYGDQL